MIELLWREFLRAEREAERTRIAAGIVRLLDAETRAWTFGDVAL